MPGVTMNLSKSGASMSFGMRGAHYTVGPRGRRATVGIPGTGLFYTQSLTSKRAAGPRRAQPVNTPSPVIASTDRLTLGFWQRLTTSADEKELVEGIKAVLSKDDDAALTHLRLSTHLADGAFMAGFYAYKRQLLDEAERDLNLARTNLAQLGSTLHKYGAELTVTLAITETLGVHLGLNEQSVLLALVEVYQHQKRWDEARACLERLAQIAPADIVVTVSLIELMLDQTPDDKATFQRVLDLTSGLSNDSAVHAAALLYRARALRGLGLAAAAIETLGNALARKKDRDDELLHALRYERGLAFEAVGQAKRARTEFERIYAENPKFEDVAKQLGVT